MPKLSDSTFEATRLLIVGDPGSGKTSAVGYLLNHGQRLFIADFDSKLNVIARCVSGEALKNLYFESLLDKVRPDKVTGYPTTIGKPTAYRKFINLTSKWVDSSSGEDFGAPESWGPNDWLVIDSLTSLGRAILFYLQDGSGKLGQRALGPVVWRVADMIEGVVSTLRSYPINSIMLAHLAPLSASEDFVVEEQSSDPVKQENFTARMEAKLSNPNSNMRYPLVQGSKKLPRHIGGYFSAVLMTKRVGSGEQTKRVIRTAPDEDVDVQVPVAPKSLPAELPLTDLYKVIEAIRAKPTT